MPIIRVDILGPFRAPYSALEVAARAPGRGYLWAHVIPGPEGEPDAEAIATAASNTWNEVAALTFLGRLPEETPTAD